jgi:hypothetical protein
MREMTFLFSAGMAHFVLPAAYFGLCFWMFRRRVWWFTYVAYFFVFGSFGGWLLTLEFAALGPAPLFVLPALGMEFFLLTAAVLACLASSLVLQFRKRKDPFEQCAMYGGYTFLGLHSAFLMSMVYHS